MTFSYELPRDRIAQRPIIPYHAAKLLVVNRASGQINHSTFESITNLLRPDDLLVFNDSKVIPARIFGEVQGEPGELEALLLEEIGSGRWRCIGKPLKRFQVGKRVNFGGSLSAEVESKQPEEFILRFDITPGENLTATLEKIGCMPIPPYIRDGLGDEQDRRDYQPPLAEITGSIAASTASLHFTQELLQKIESFGCKIRTITLHIGLSSIRAVEGSRGPGSEALCVSHQKFQEILKLKESGSRVIAVGTSVARAIETLARLPDIDAQEQHLKTDLFIRPPFEFKVVGGLVTNFHQPQTTHLLLVEALLGRELLQTSYNSALEGAYRFLSYGDGMLIV